MRLWGYYAWHTFWNTIKKMFRSTFLVIILAIFGFGIIFGLIGGVVGSMVEKQQSLETVESSSEADRVQEDAMEEEETQKTPQEIAAIKTYVEAGVMIVFLAILLWGMYSGSKDGTDIFQMADVNLLFTAPMKPQSVLMFVPFGSLLMTYVFAPRASYTDFATRYDAPFAQSRPILIPLKGLVGIVSR